MGSGVTGGRLSLLVLLPFLLLVNGCPTNTNAKQPSTSSSISPPGTTSKQSDRDERESTSRRVPTRKVESPDLRDLAQSALGEVISLSPLIYDSTKLPWQKLEQCCQIPYGSLRGLPVIFAVIGKTGRPVGYVLQVTDGGTRVAALVVDRRLRPLRMRGNSRAQQIMELSGKVIISSVAPSTPAPDTDRFAKLGLSPFEALAAREMARQLVVGLTFLAERSAQAD